MLRVNHDNILNPHRPACKEYLIEQVETYLRLKKMSFNIASFSRENKAVLN